MARALRRPGQATCVVTAGAQGCWYTTQESGDELYHVPACVVQVVDTTGCGNIFHGAYAGQPRPAARAWRVPWRWPPWPPA